MVTRKQIVTGMLVPVGLAIAACSSSKDATPNTADATDSQDVQAVIPPITELNEGAAPSSGPVTCGAMACTVPAGGPVMLTACCLADNTCGASLDLAAMGVSIPGADGGGAIGCLDTSPGPRDPSCPSQTEMGVALAGCCSKAGTCGVDLSIAGLGCNSFAGLGGGAIAGSPQLCGDAGVSADAGVGADGGGAPASDATADAAADATSAAVADAASE
jgi:hypothetical protein